MKKICMLLISLLTLSGASAQSCLPEGITFSFQSQINAFQSNYPSCQRIEGDVTISGYNISNLNGLSVLTSIGGNIKIECNEVLTTLNGLNNLTSIGGTLYLEGNMSLTSLSGFNNLNSIGGSIILTNNVALTSLAGLSQITSVGGMLLIDYNNELTSLNGLNNVETIAGNARISANPTLMSLDGLTGLTTIGENLIIGGQGHLGGLGNPCLASLDGLGNVTYVGGNIEVGYNTALPSLAGLDNIAAESVEDLYIYNNSALSLCEVRSVCDYLSSPNGTIQISDNATGCNSREEVFDACAILPSGEISAGLPFSIYPNPASSAITIETPVSHNTCLVCLMSIGGRVVLTQKITGNSTDVNIMHLPNGLYFVRITHDSMVWTGKFLKQ